MRIAFVAYEGSIHTQRWAEFFALRGHDVHVVTCGGVSDSPRPYTVHDLGAVSIKPEYFARTWRARQTIADINPDIVHAHFATSYGLLALAAQRSPLVVTAHGSDLLQLGLHSSVMRAILRRVLRAADLITVPSEQMRSVANTLLRESGSSDLVSPKRIDVFQYGIEAQRLLRVADSVREDPARRDVLKIVSSRSLHPVYQVDALIQALAILQARGTNFVCDILGDGPQRRSLEKLVHRLGLAERVHFYGHCSPMTVEQFVARADVYASVSKSDGASLSLLEAMALGATPVVSDIPANRPWIEDGTNGFLVAPDPASIAEGIDRTQSLWKDRVTMANRAIILERADRTALLSSFEQTLLDLVDGSQRDSATTHEAPLAA